MNMEDAVRERHAFEDRVKQLLDLASMMTDRELEIALAKLVDLLNSQPHQQEDIQIRGEILNSYYDLRRRGIKKQRKLKRALIVYPDGLPPRDFKTETTFSDYLARIAATYPLLSDGGISPPPFSNETIEQSQKDDNAALEELSDKYEDFKDTIINEVKKSLKTKEEIRILEGQSRLTYIELINLGSDPNQLTDMGLSVYRLLIDRINKSLGNEPEGA